MKSLIHALRLVIGDTLGLWDAYVLNKLKGDKSVPEHLYFPETTGTPFN